MVNLKALNKFMTRKRFKMEAALLLRDLLYSGEGLEGIDRLKGHLFLCDHGPKRLEIAPVQLARSDL